MLPTWWVFSVIVTLFCKGNYIPIVRTEWLKFKNLLQVVDPEKIEEMSVLEPISGKYEHWDDWESWEPSQFVVQNFRCYRTGTDMDGLVGKQLVTISCNALLYIFLEFNQLVMRYTGQFMLRNLGKTIFVRWPHCQQIGKTRCWRHGSSGRGSWKRMQLLTMAKASPLS